MIASYRPRLAALWAPRLAVRAPDRWVVIVKRSRRNLAGARATVLYKTVQLSYRSSLGVRDVRGRSSIAVSIV